MMNLGPYELDSIITGDVRELARALPDESVDLIFTDPVYNRIEDYAWLAEIAARILKPDSAALVWFDEPNFSEAFDALRTNLHFAAMMHWQRHGHMAPSRSGLTVITPCLWMEKGRSKTYQRIANWFPTANNGMGAFTHYWGKPEALVRKWLSAFTMPEAIVVDFFCGGGTVPAACKMLSRHYLAFEIDPATAENARERVHNTQPPLFIPAPEQATMFEGQP